MKSVRVLWLLCCGIGLPVRGVESIVSEGVINAPVAAVWAAFTTPEGLRAWLAPHAEVDLRIDGMMRTNYNPDGRLGDAGTIENRILAYEPERLLVIRVAKPPANFPFKDVVADMWTVIHFLPGPEGKTVLRTVGLGFDGREQSQKMKAFFQRGNDYTVAKLQERFPAASP